MTSYDILQPQDSQKLGQPASPETYVFTATRFVLELPEPKDRVRVTVLTNAFQKLGNEAMHLTLGNVYSGQQDLTGALNINGSEALTGPLTVTGTATVSALTSTGQLAMVAAPSPGGLPTYLPGPPAAPTDTMAYYTYQSIKDDIAASVPNYWQDDGATLSPLSPGRAVRSWAAFHSAAGIYLEASNVVRLYWDGTYHHNTHSHYSDGDLVAGANLQANGTVVYFEASRQVYIQYRGDLGALWAPYGNGFYTTQFHSSGGGMYWEGSNAVRTYWDGTYVHSTHNSYSDGNMSAVAFSPRGNAAWVDVSGAVNFRWDGVEYIVASRSVHAVGRFRAEADYTFLPVGPGYTWPGTGGPVSGGGVYPGSNVGQPSNVVYMVAHGFVFWDLTVQHTVFANNYVTTSALKDKDDVADLSDEAALALIANPAIKAHTYKLREPQGSVTLGEPPQEYTYDYARETAPGKTSEQQIGLIAEEVGAVAPEFLARDANGDVMGVTYGNMVALLWAAVRLLDQRVQAMEKAA